MQSVQVSLVMVGLNTDNPQYFWNGHKLNYVVRMNAEIETDERRIKLIVNDPANDQSSIYAEMIANGVNVKQIRGA